MVPNKVCVEKQKPGVNPRQTVYLVSLNQSVIGMLVKWKDSSSAKCPWQALKGTGEGASLVGSFYPADGGKAAAVKALVASLKL